MKIQVAAQNEALHKFKVEVARTYTTGDVITHMERRIDDLVTSMREEMATTFREMIQAITGHPPADLRYLHPSTHRPRGFGL